VKRVFVDTGAFYAMQVTEDAHHQRARELFEQANAEVWRLITTNVVVFETFTLMLIRARDGRRHAIQLLDAIEGDRYQVERVRQVDERHASTLVRAHADKRYSMCDALSFVVMERLKIKEALSFDRHFKMHG